MTLGWGAAWREARAEGCGRPCFYLTGCWSQSQGRTQRGDPRRARCVAVVLAKMSM